MYSSLTFLCSCALIAEAHHWLLRERVKGSFILKRRASWLTWCAAGFGFWAIDLRRIARRCWRGALWLARNIWRYDIAPRMTPLRRRWANRTFLRHRAPVAQDSLAQVVAELAAGNGELHVGEDGPYWVRCLDEHTAIATKDRGWS